jgi:hypothetical protein
MEEADLKSLLNQRSGLLAPNNFLLAHHPETIATCGGAFCDRENIWNATGSESSGCVDSTRNGCYTGTPMWRVFVALLLLSTVSLAPAKADSLDRLASDFWTWRANYRSFTFDDVPRMEHSSGVREWSPAAVAKQRVDLAEFERQWNDLHTDGWPAARMVDYQLMGFAIARVRWELDINPRWQRDPAFYVEQTVGALREEFLPPPPFDEVT